MKKKMVMVMLMIVAALCDAAQAVSIEELILGPAPPAGDCDVRVAEAVEPADPIGIVLGLQAGPDFDNADNEFGVNLGLRLNLFEIGPNVMFWPGNEDLDTAYGIYALRHLGYQENILGTQFFGFRTTIAGKSGDMYAFISGTDRQIQENVFLRAMFEWRNFSDAMAAAHSDESDEWVARIGPIFLF